MDQAIGDLLLKVVSPLALTVTLAAEEELQSRIEEADALRSKRVERAEYEADLAIEGDTPTRNTVLAIDRAGLDVGFWNRGHLGVYTAEQLGYLQGPSLDLESMRPPARMALSGDCLLLLGIDGTLDRYRVERGKAPVFLERLGL